MAGRGEGDVERTKILLVPPVEFRYQVCGYTPLHQMSFYAQGHKVPFGLMLQFLNTGVVQVIVMVVGEQEQIDFGKIVNEV